jgi:hypothetical protein
MEESRAPFGASMLVAVGWFVTVGAALAVGEWSVPEQPDLECASFGCGLSLLDFLPAIVVLAGTPLMLLLMAVTAGVRRLPVPAAVAGTLSAVATLAVVAAGATLYTAAR